MARRSKGQRINGQQLEDAGDGAIAQETIVFETPGETHTHRIIREWHPQATETLPEIHEAIDSWGRSTLAEPEHRMLDYSELEHKVDRLTKRVKGQNKVVVQETVTEWVERPAREEEVPFASAEDVMTESPAPERSRPKRRFLGFIGRPSPKADKKDKKKAAKADRADKGKQDRSDPDYRPQCSALTEDGAQCRNSARHGSRYCISHFGYQPPTAKGLAQRIEGDSWDPSDDLTDHQSVGHADTRPAVGKAKDTRLKTRKVAKKGRGKKR